MARGFFSGIIAGTLVSGLGLGAASVVIGIKDGPRPEAAALDVPAGSEFNQSRDDTKASLPEMSEGPEAAPAPRVSVPEPDTTAALSEAATAPAAQPETGQAASGLGQPQDGAGAAGVAVESESPVLPSPQAAAPEQPAGEGDLSISTDPAQPAPPEAEPGAFADDPAEAATEDLTGDLTGDAASESAAPSAEADSQPEAVTAAPEMVAPTGMTPGETETAQMTVPETAPEEPQGTAAPEAETDADAAVRDDAPPSGTIGNLATEVETNRLPSVGDPVEAETPETDATADAAAQAPAEDATIPPLQRFAAAFENPEGKPLMSIVLIDDGTSPVGLSALQSFPYPLTFAVDAAWDGAEDAMAGYRAAGFEVMAMIDLPEGAGPQDAEVTMQSVLARLSEVVAVMEGPGSGLQSSRDAARQLAPILLESGHGAVFFPKGLNTAQQLLAREGVPAVSVFRDFDASGQDATVIRRFLDQAAFKAGQEDAGVVMVGRLRPDTVSALLLWGLQDRISRVTLAPISALLLGK